MAPAGDLSIPAVLRAAAQREGVVHVIHHAVSARSFIVPVVMGLRARGVAAELWSEPDALAHPALSGLPLPMAEAVCDLGGDVLRTPWRLWPRWWRLVRALRSRRPAVVHAHQTRSALLPLAAAALAGVKRRVYHNHGLPYLGHGGVVRLGLRLCERLNCALATHVLLVSPSNLMAGRKDGLFAGIHAEVLGHGSICGIDTQRYTAPDAVRRATLRRAQGIAEAAFVLGWVGRPQLRKGLPLLLSAWERSGLAAQGAVLLVAGCTPAQCRALHGVIPAGVMALGQVERMEDLYACCDALALVSAHEGLSYALLEAGACGVALIGSDIPGTSDAIQHGVTGLLVAQTPEAVAAAITRLASDRAECRRLGANARQRVIALYSRERVMDALHRYYRQRLGVGRER